LVSKKIVIKKKNKTKQTSVLILLYVKKNYFFVRARDG